MLEHPECVVLAHQINETLSQKTVTNAVAAKSPHRFTFYLGDPANYPAMIVGKTCNNARAFGGMVEWSVGDMTILFFDGINVRYLPESSPIPDKHQLHLTMDDGSSIICSTQMYGGIWIFPEGQATNKYYAAAKEKPAVLSDAFDRAYFEKLFKESKPNLSAKAFLATEQRIPGLGNGVLQDILFKSGLHPKTKIGSLSDSQREKLFDCVKHLVAEMAESGGRDTEKDLFGQMGGYKTIMSSKNLMHPCPNCGGTITRQAYLGGNVYFCPNCQPLG